MALSCQPRGPLHAQNVGFHMDERMTKELCLKALDQAYRLQKPKGNVLHHSDRGSQYASLDDQQRLRRYGMTSSMSRKGNCYDNGVPRRLA